MAQRGLLNSVHTHRDAPGGDGPVSLKFCEEGNRFDPVNMRPLAA